jgi:hypothetical protein
MPKKGKTLYKKVKRAREANPYFLAKKSNTNCPNSMKPAANSPSLLPTPPQTTKHAF